MKRPALIFALCALMSAGLSQAQQATEFDEYVVHYNALKTSLLTPQVAQSYGIQRSSNRALLNITVLARGQGGADSPVQAAVEATATNLTGQRRDIIMREITTSEGAVYYIGELRVHNLETFDFAVRVLPDGESEALDVTFRQQFYTE